MTVGAERGEIAEVGSPVTVPADPAIDRRHPLRWTSVALALAALFLALFNAGTATQWLDERTPTAATERLRAPLERWRAATAAIGLDRPRAALHHVWEKARAARFGGEHPGEPGQ